MITFENIKTGEKVTFEAGQDPVARQAHMAAYLNSSNLHPNALKGQDFGWRLAPEIVAQMDRIKGDMNQMDMLSRRIGVAIDDVRDFHILNYIAEQDFAAEAMREAQRNSNTVYEQEYEERLRKLRAQDQPVDDAVEVEKSEEVNGNSESDSAKIELPTKAKVIKKEEKSNGNASS